VVAHSLVSDRAFTQGSTWTRAFVFAGDRTTSTWTATINNKWAENDTDNTVLATGSIAESYDIPTDKTTVTVTFDGDIVTFPLTKNLTNSKDRASAVEGVNYYVWELLETPPSGLPWKPFTGYVEVYPGASL
jgi:hypothetical protein